MRDTDRETETERDRDRGRQTDRETESEREITNERFVFIYEGKEISNQSNKNIYLQPSGKQCKAKY